MSQSHGIKGRTTDGAFQQQCFLWERGASVVEDFEIFYMHVKLCDTLKERKKVKA